MVKSLLITSLLILGCLSFRPQFEEFENLWEAWKQAHSKTYDRHEEANRFSVFLQNYNKIQNHNSANGGVKLALNKFADLTPEEFKNQYCRCYLYDKKEEELVQANLAEFSAQDLPDSVDWREQGAVTDVKNQGQCGSCWAFSTTGALEGLYYLKNNKLISFSEQQLVDCDRKDDGCDGGLPNQALAYAAKMGLETEGDYPYTEHDGRCKYKKSQAVHVNTGFKFVPPKNANALKSAAAKQPVSVAIEADENVFQFYSSGVITGQCGGDLDHAVLVVGYTTIEGQDAFIVKNSWGSDWGNQGYVYISTNSRPNNGNGVCGILAEPVIPY